MSLWISALSVLVYGMGIWNAAHAVMNVRTSQGAIAWALALLMFPWVALPLYWVLGRWKFWGYLEAFRQIYREHNYETQSIYQQIIDVVRSPPAPWDALHDLAQSLTEIPFTGKNSIQLLRNGEQTFPAMLEAIAAAQDYIFLETYILRDDETGVAFQQALIHQAQRGVRVYLLYDAVGCIKLDKAYVQTLKHHGIQVAVFRSSHGWRDRFQMNFRNHRKILIVDGITAFAGGLNLADEYLGKVPRFGDWRDTHLQLWGPAVLSLQLTFFKDWYWCTRWLPDAQWQVRQAPNHSDQVALVFPTGPVEPIDDCTYFFCQLIHSARERLWIASPYFVPDESVLTALKTAAFRGVEVRILLPARPDHLLVYLSSYSYYQEMETAGISLYRYEPGFMHQKVVLVDNAIAAVGTVNLDNRSFRLNFEVMIFVYDALFVRDVESMLSDDFKHSCTVDFQNYQKKWIGFKLAVNIARLLAPLQ